MTSSLQQGINAAKAGRMQEALEFLKDAIIEEPQNAEVWVWIAAIIDDVDKQAIFLEKALEIDPHNIPAQRGLAYLEKRKQDEASVREDHLSDHTHPISPFPSSGGRTKTATTNGWTTITDEKLDNLVESTEQKRADTDQSTDGTLNATKLTPFEIGLLGVVALVFCFIGLLAGSALFGFELPLAFLQGERSTLVSAPPYPGVFLYENEMFFELQMHQGLPTLDQGIPTSQKTLPQIVLWQTLADRNEMKLIYETGAYIPIRAEQGKNEVVQVFPSHELQPGLYCFQQLIGTDEGADAIYWCFKLIH
jgi:tetratricopeptide (TPR) repeat protein